MRVVSTVDEGRIIVEHMRKFDKVNVQGHFGQLTFEVDAGALTVNECNDFLDELSEVSDVINCYLDEYRRIEFNYYVTQDLLPDIRSIVDKYCQPVSRGILLYWIFDNEI